MAIVLKRGQKIMEDKNSLFQGIPLVNKSWLHEVLEKADQKYANVPKNIDITLVVDYPKTPENSPTYIPTGEVPICIIRLGDSFTEESYLKLSRLIKAGQFALDIKTYIYPTYPILQLVLIVKDENGKIFWFWETLGDICNGDIKGFTIELLNQLKWSLYVSSYNPLRTRQNRKLFHSVSNTVNISKEEAQKFSNVVLLASTYYLKIPNDKINYNLACDQFAKDDLPIKGIDFP